MQPRGDSTTERAARRGEGERPTAGEMLAMAAVAALVLLVARLEYVLG